MKMAVDSVHEDFSDLPALLARTLPAAGYL